jgi:hypothetical protein
LRIKILAKPLILARPEQRLHPRNRRYQGLEPLWASASKFRGPETGPRASWPTAKRPGWPRALIQAIELSGEKTGAFKAGFPGKVILEN